MSRTIQLGAVDQRVRFKILQTTGLPAEGVAHNAAGMALWYQRSGGAKVAIALAPGTGLTDPHADGAWNEVDDGWYQVDAPDGAFAAAGAPPSVQFGGDLPAHVIIGEPIQLVAYDPMTGANNGTGARTVVITVTDGTDPLQNALVRVTAGLYSWLVQTNVDGQALFNLDDATYVLAITKAGYAFAGTTLEVDGDEAEIYAMDAVAISPSPEPDTVNAYLVTRNELGPIAGVSVQGRLIDAPEGTGSAFIANRFRGTSDENGLFQFTAYLGACYELIIGGNVLTVEIPAEADDPYELDNQLAAVACD